MFYNPKSIAGKILELFKIWGKYRTTRSRVGNGFNSDNFFHLTHSNLLLLMKKRQSSRKLGLGSSTTINNDDSHIYREFLTFSFGKQEVLFS